SDNTFGKQVVAGTLSSIKIRCRRFDRQVNHAQFGIRCYLGPNACVAVYFRRVVFPGVIPELAFFRNGIERPNELSGLDIESTGLTLGIVVGLNGHAFFHRDTDDNPVAEDERSRMKSRFPRFEVDLFSGTAEKTDLQVKISILPKCRDPIS